MFTLSPATTHSSLAVSPSGTVTVEGSPVIVSSPGPKEEALSRYANHAQPVPPDLKGPWLQALFHSALHLTQNSELDPSLVAVLPIEGDTSIEATVFHSHMADDQRAIGLQLVSGDQTESGGSIPPDSKGQGRGRVFLFPGERLSGPYC